MSLADLMRKGSLRGLATATPATVATHEAGIGPTVARVATVAVAMSPSGKAADDPATDADRWCWPRSSAMNTAEIGRFEVPLAKFTARGLTLTDAEALADKLVIRDRDGDDRRLCLECAHLRRSGDCGARVPVDSNCRGLIAPLPILQRCAQFSEVAP